MEERYDPTISGGRARRHSLVEFSGLGDGASLSGTLLAESTPAAPTLTITVSIVNVVLLAAALLVAGMAVGALWDGDGVGDSLELSALLVSAVAGPAAAVTWFNSERCIKRAVARAVMATGEPRD